MSQSHTAARRFRRAFPALLSAALCSIPLFMQHALAQEAPPAPGDAAGDATTVPPPAAASAEAAAIAEVVVTGSRVVRDGSQAPTPVTVLSAEQLQLASPGPIGEALVQQPAFRGSNRPTSGGVSSVGPGSGSFLNLRNLGVQRTLILLDGRRAAHSALFGITDTNLLPQELVKRVDIVTGGASAAYGSDAVAGVVNFVLDSDYEGLKGTLQGGTSTQGDGNSQKYNLTGGTSFAGGKGHVVFSGSYLDYAGLKQTDRDWASDARWGLLPDPANPQMLRRYRDVGLAYASYGGVTFAPGAPWDSLQFGPGGTVRPFNQGIGLGANRAGGDGAWLYTNLQADVKTSSAFTHLKYQLLPSLEVFVEAAFIEGHNRYMQVDPYQFAFLNAPTIYNDNVFMPAAMRAILTQYGVPQGTDSALFRLGRVSQDLAGPSTADALNDTFNAVTGFKFDAGGGWTVDGYYEHGENRQRIRTENNINHEHLYAAADAVAGPGGTPVCRVTITHPGLYPGCVPINLFGFGSPSRDAIDYVTGDAWYVTKLKQDVVAASVRGEPFSTWAGPVAVGFGAEYRREEVDQTSDAVSQQMNDATGIRGFPVNYTVAPGGWLMTNQQPLTGAYNIREGYLEFLAPLAKDIPALQSLDFNGAVRVTDYSTSGEVTTWKAGLSWKPINDLRVRATRSRDIRAPGIAELFAGSAQGQLAVVDPQNNNTTTMVITNSLGNPNLDPEEADTFTGGFIYQPSWLPGFTASVDYYNIDLQGVIDTLSAQQTVDQCQAGSGVACGNIDRDPATHLITRIRLPRLNLTAQKTSGVDFELGYRSAVPGGRLDLRAIASWLEKYETQVPGGGTIDRTGEVGLSSNPRWAGNLSATYSSGPWIGFVQERMVGGGRYDNSRQEGRTIDKNNIGTVFYTDATLAYTVGSERTFQLYLTINNLLDRDPPIIPMGSPIFFPTNNGLYDIMGRYFTAGVKFEL
ncbi:MAG: TonB-dependent receptor plug domain-containing protein [Solimonas sp.]